MARRLEARWLRNPEPDQPLREAPRETLPKDASRTMPCTALAPTCRNGPARAEWSERHQHHPIVTISVSVDQSENKKNIIRSFLRSTRAALSWPHFAPGWVARDFSFTAITYTGSRVFDCLARLPYNTEQITFRDRKPHFFSGWSLIPSSRFINLSTSALRISDFIRSGNGMDPSSTARFSR